MARTTRSLLFICSAQFFEAPSGDQFPSSPVVPRSCLRADHDANYKGIAALLRDIDTCTMDRRNEIDSTPSGACDFDEHAWHLSCVYPWDLPPGNTRWASTPPTFLGSFSPGQMLVFTSDELQINRLSDDAKTRIFSDLANFEACHLLVDGEVVPPGSYNVAVGFAVEVSIRLYFSSGFHHAVVLATNRASHVRPGLVRFLSFWFEMEPNDVSQLEFGERDVRVGRAGHGSAEHSPIIVHESWNYHRDYHFVTCCAKFGSVYYHTDSHAPSRKVEWVADGNRSGSTGVYHQLPMVPLQQPYKESSCQHVWADVIIFNEMGPHEWQGSLSSCSHYWMEFLSNLFFVVESRADSDPTFADSIDGREQKPIFIMSRQPRRARLTPHQHALSGSPTLPPFHAALWSMLSDHEWMDFDAVLAMVHAPPGGGGPSLVCFRRLHTLQDYNMTKPNSPESAPYWRKYRESLWAHLRVPSMQHGAPAEIRRVLFLRRPASITRRLLNHDEIAAVLQADGFEVHSITPDRLSLSAVASAVVQASLLIGINSGAYNAVFLQTGCGVLELAPHGIHSDSDTSFRGIMPWQIGFERLGVHQIVYACPLLFPRGFLGLAPTAFSIVVSPKTIITLLHELAETLQRARKLGSEAASISVQRCFSWEASHAQSWAPHHAASAG